MDLITSTTGKDTLTYVEMKRQPYKLQFITEMKKEISDHEKSKNWGYSTDWKKGANTIISICSFREKRENIIGKAKNTKPESVRTVECRRKA